MWHGMCHVHSPVMPGCSATAAVSPQELLLHLASGAEAHALVLCDTTRSALRLHASVVVEAAKHGPQRQLDLGDQQLHGGVGSGFRV